jgi:hypothetical protein
MRRIIRIALCLGALFIALACGLPNGSGTGNGLAPIRTITLTLDKSQRETFFSQLQKFAENHGFETRLTDFNTKGESFQFWMSRKDVFITASDVPPDPTLVYVFFYKYSGATIDEEIIDELLNELKSFINEVPNVMIMEE